MGASLVFGERTFGGLALVAETSPDPTDLGETSSILSLSVAIQPSTREARIGSKSCAGYTAQVSVRRGDGGEVVVLRSDRLRCERRW